MHPRKPVIVAIDGPAGAGKSTVARTLAGLLGFLHIDTGAMYRAVALAALRRGVDPADGEALAALARACRIDLEPVGGGNRVLLDGEDVTEAVRTPEVTRATGAVADNPEVREWLVAQQRRLGRKNAAPLGGAVLEGRDIGTVVFPDAEFKFYLDASPEVRARRRLRDLEAAGRKVVFEEVLRELEERDERDRMRAVGGLRVAEGAVVLDHSHLTVEESARELQRIIQERLSNS